MLLARSDDVAAGILLCPQYFTCSSSSNCQILKTIYLYENARAGILLAVPTAGSNQLPFFHLSMQNISLLRQKLPSAMDKLQMPTSTKTIGNLYIFLRAGRRKVIFVSFFPKLFFSSKSSDPSNMALPRRGIIGAIAIIAVALLAAVTV
jgi:hypothetical protein